jgi:hypothetical protein
MAAFKPGLHDSYSMSYITVTARAKRVFDQGQVEAASRVDGQDV